MTKFNLKKEILATKKLTKTENLKLIKEAKRGNKKAMQDAVLYNGRLVLNYIERYSDVSEKEDMLQVGLIGVTKAIELYDETRGAAFSTFAMFYIKQEIFRYLKKEYEFIALPNCLAKVISSARKYVRECGTIPSDVELREEFGLSDKQMEAVKLYLAPRINLEENLDIAETKYQMASSAETLVEQKDMMSRIRNLFDAAITDDAQRQVITLRYGMDGKEPLTQKEVAEVMQRSSTRIEQREWKALRYIRYFMNDNPETKDLKVYLS